MVQSTALILHTAAPEAPKPRKPYKQRVTQWQRVRPFLGDCFSFWAFSGNDPDRIRDTKTIGDMIKQAAEEVELVENRLRRAKHLLRMSEMIAETIDPQCVQSTLTTMSADDFGDDIAEEIARYDAGRWADLQRGIGW